MASLTGQAQAALVSLYDQEKHASENFTLERIERALDAIVRLNSTNPPEQQVRDAMHNASKVICSRRRTVSPDSIEARQVDVPGLGGDENVVDLTEWLRCTPSVTGRQRELLGLLTYDLNAADLAVVYHGAEPRIREQISRARRAARTAYHHETGVA